MPSGSDLAISWFWKLVSCSDLIHGALDRYPDEGWPIGKPESSVNHISVAKVRKCLRFIKVFLFFFQKQFLEGGAFSVSSRGSRDAGNFSPNPQFSPKFFEIIIFAVFGPVTPSPNHWPGSGIVRNRTSCRILISLDGKHKHDYL